MSQDNKIDRTGHTGPAARFSEGVKRNPLATRRSCELGFYEFLPKTSLHTEITWFLTEGEVKE